MSNDRVYPSRIKNGTILFDQFGSKVEVYAFIELAGVFYFSTLNLDSGATTEWEYDSHDYTGEGGEIPPALYRKNPKKR